MKHDNKSENEYHKAKERCHWAIQNWAQGIIAVVSAFAFIAAAVSVCFSYRAFKEAQEQANAAKDQVDIMRDQTRPWIRANISLARPIRFTDWANNKFVHVALNFELKNFGNIPAINIRITTFVSPHPGNDKRQKLDADEAAACKQTRDMADSDKIGGTASFPGEPVTIETVVGTGVIRQYDRPIIFSVLGCVDYTYSDNRHGQTGFRKMLGRIEGDFVAGLPFVVGLPRVADPPISQELLASGYPKEPPIIGYMPQDRVWFRDEDSGNYAK